MPEETHALRGGPAAPGRLASHAALVLLSAVSVLPVLWMLLSSLKNGAAIAAGSLLPRAPTLANYAAVFAELPILRMLVNTLVMAAAVTVLQCATSLLAAYAFGRWRFAADWLLYTLIIGTWLVPFQITMIPNYVVIAGLHWLNTLQALIVPQLAAAFGVILLTQAMRAFPAALFDAASLDGAGSWAALWRVVLPNLRAPLAALAVLQFINSWNEYFWPLLVTDKASHTVLQVGLQMFFTDQGNQWGPLMAAASLASLPILAIFLLSQRQVIEAFVRSGLK